LKYLGKTIMDPYTYKGSGKYWKRHIEKHGYNVTTEVIFESDSKEEIKEKGLYYSKLWNVDSNSQWANLIPETGEGCDTSSYINYEERRDPDKSYVVERKKRYYEKYGVYNHTSLKESKEKLKKSVLEKYGVTHVSKIPSVKEKLKEQAKVTNSNLSSREIVALLRELKKHKTIPELKQGWYKKSEEYLTEIYDIYNK